jgi:quercetin dioxygenase-like cupin family protein
MMTTSVHEEIRIGGMAIRFLVEGEQSGGVVSVFSVEVPVGTRVAAAHSHDGFEETIYGLDCVLTWTLDGVPIEVGPGEALLIPRGVVHQFANNADVDAKALAIGTPGVLGPDYFRDVAAVLDAAAGGPPDMAALEVAMRRHGLTLVT